MIPLRDDQQDRTFPLVTIMLVALNVYVFVVWQLKAGIQQTVDQYGFLPIEFTSHLHGGWVHLFMAMFMHGGWMHLIGNMWFLWVFGMGVENNCGHLRFLLFYLLSGIAATLAFTAIAPQSEVPLVGASGAISGLLGAYLLHHPNARILTFVPIFFVFFRIIEIRAWIFLIFWIGLNIFSQVQASSHGTGGGGVAYVAHIGGFITGMILIVFFEKGRDRERSHA